MGEIAIRYWSPHGRQEETKYQTSDKKIDFTTRAAKRVDLSNLRKCTNLEILSLANNMLEELDLTPLSENTFLTEIQLENNHLTTLDLWPLGYCESLSHLNLTQNRLQNLDLTPILSRVKVLLDSSVVIYADYTLRFFLKTKELAERFLLVRPDRAPWTAPPVLIWTELDTVAKKMKWSKIRERILTILDQISREKWYHIQRGLLIGLGMAELSGFDGNPAKLVDTTDDTMNYETAKQAIFNRAVELLEEQIDHGGPTLFLDTEAMIETSASKLISKIIDARKLEIENTTILTKASVTLMNSLWLTHYGYNILKALNVGLRHFGTEDKVKQSFSELGFTLKTEEVDSLETTKINDPVNASHSMKDFIFNQIENAYH